MGSNGKFPVNGGFLGEHLDRGFSIAMEGFGVFSRRFLDTSWPKCRKYMCFWGTRWEVIDSRILMMSLIMPHICSAFLHMVSRTPKGHGKFQVLAIGWDGDGRRNKELSWPKRMALKMERPKSSKSTGEASMFWSSVLSIFRRDRPIAIDFRPAMPWTQMDPTLPRHSRDPRPVGDRGFTAQCAKNVVELLTVRGPQPRVLPCGHQQLGHLWK